MNVEEFKKKYEELKDNPMYQNFCSILDTKNEILERIAKENEELRIQVSSREEVANKYKEVIDKATSYVEQHAITVTDGNITTNKRELLDILKRWNK